MPVILGQFRISDKLRNTSVGFRTVHRGVGNKTPRRTVKIRSGAFSAFWDTWNNGYGGWSWGFPARLWYRRSNGLCPPKLIERAKIMDNRYARSWREFLLGSVILARLWLGASPTLMIMQLWEKCLLFTTMVSLKIERAPSCQFNCVKMVLSEKLYVALC